MADIGKPEKTWELPAPTKVPIKAPTKTPKPVKVPA